MKIVIPSNATEMFSFVMHTNLGCDSPHQNVRNSSFIAYLNLQKVGFMLTVNTNHHAHIISIQFANCVNKLYSALNTTTNFEEHINDEGAHHGLREQYILASTMTVPGVRRSGRRKQLRR